MLHYLEPPSAKTDAPYAELEQVDAKTGSAPICPLCGGYVGMLQRLPPYEYKLIVRANRAPDLVVEGDDIVFVSSYLHRLIAEAGLSGLEVVGAISIVKVNARPRLEHEPPDYVYLRPRRLDYRIDWTNSDVKPSRRAKCERCLGGSYHAGNRIVLSPGSWQGEDIFKVDAIPGCIIISQRFRSLLIEHQIWNCEMPPCQILSIPEA